MEDGNQDPISLLLVTAFLQQCEAAFKMFMVKGLGQWGDLHIFNSYKPIRVSPRGAYT